VETETLASLRDLSIVIVALEVIVINIMLVVLIIQITRLIRLMLQPQKVGLTAIFTILGSIFLFCVGASLFFADRQRPLLQGR